MVFVPLKFLFFSKTTRRFFGDSESSSHGIAPRISSDLLAASSELLRRDLQRRSVEVRRLVGAPGSAEHTGRFVGWLGWRERGTLCFLCL